MFKKFFLIFIAVAFLSSARADEASGQYILNFDEPASIWDISGDYEDVIDGFTLSYTIISDPRGRFEGLGSFNFEDDDGNVFDGELTFRGKVRSGRKVVRASMRSRLSGTGIVSGEEDDFDATILGSIRKRQEIDSSSLQLDGRATSNFRIDAPGFVHTNASLFVPDLTTDIPLGMDGTWELTMNVFPDGNSNYTGNATINLSNGSEYDFLLAGRHLPSDLSKFKLQGDDTNPRSRFKLTTTVTNNETANEIFIQSLRGKILGQRVRFPR